jgi:hypothetical protein
MSSPAAKGLKEGNASVDNLITENTHEMSNMHTDF